MDKDVLKQLGDTFKGQIDQLEKEIYLLAHKEFNISSPKQLGEVLFEDLGSVSYTHLTLPTTPYV